MNIDQAYPSKYLKSADIDKPIKVVIRGCRIEGIDEEGKEQKPVLYFNGMDRGLVLNKTNATTISSAFGSETNNWTGKTVGLWVDQTVMFGNEKRPGLRVKVFSAEPVFEEAKPDQVYAEEQSADNQTMSQEHRTPGSMTDPDFDDADIPF